MEILMNGGWIKMGVPKYVKDGRVNFHILLEIIENFVLHPYYPTKRDIQITRKLKRPLGRIIPFISNESNTPSVTHKKSF